MTRCGMCVYRHQHHHCAEGAGKFLKFRSSIIVIIIIIVIVVVITGNKNGMGTKVLLSRIVVYLKLGSRITKIV